MLKIKIARSAEKFLKSLPPKHGRQLALKILELRKEPRPHDSIQMKGNASKYYRADSGEYRIIYQIEEEHLLIILVEKRNDTGIY